MVTATVREENGEFCLAVAPATRNAGILTLLVKGTGCQIEPAIQPIWAIHWLNWVQPSLVKALKGDELPRNGPSVYVKSSSSLTTLSVPSWQW